jgi:hypothetical protein
MNWCYCCLRHLLASQFSNFVHSSLTTQIPWRYYVLLSLVTDVLACSCHLCHVPNFVFISASSSLYGRNLLNIGTQTRLVPHSLFWFHFSDCYFLMLLGTKMMLLILSCPVYDFMFMNLLCSGCPEIENNSVRPGWNLMRVLLWTRFEFNC